PQVPGASGAQPLRQYDRLHAAVHRLGQHHRFAGPLAPDRRAAAAKVADRARHVPRRDHHPHARGADRDRHADLRPPADVDRSAHQAGGPVSAESLAAPALLPEAATATEAEERVSVATQWQLMWWRFRRHKLALIASGILA